jgi:hypothetical protein
MNIHLFLEFPFTRQVWKEIESQIQEEHLWDAPSMVECFHGFFSRSSLKAFRVLPILVAWGVWLDRNTNIFEDRLWPSFKVSLQNFSLYSLYNPSRALKKSHWLEEVHINKEMPS